jgi:hypothetical protein
MSLFTRLVDDAAMFPPGNAPAELAVIEHQAYRNAWFADVVGPLVVPDTALAQVGRLADPSTSLGSEGLAVSVVNTGGAGGLVALARRDVPGVRVVAVESALRDLDDLVGNAQRVAAAASDLDPDITVYVELPYVLGWIQAVEVIEGAGLLGKIRTGGLEPAALPSPEQLAEQLSVLVEADLAFKATAGLHHAWPNHGRDTGGRALPQHGFLNLMLALEALIDGAEPVEAADLLRLEDRSRITAAVRSWDEATGQRVRRRLRSFGCCGVLDPVDDLVALGLLQAPPA